MPFHTQHLGDACCGLQLDPVALVVIHGQRQQLKAGFAGEAAGDHRIQTSGKEEDGGAGAAHGAGYNGPSRKETGRPADGTAQFRQ